MNNERRKRIQAVQRRLEEINGMIEDARSDLESIRDEEQEAYDALPEAFQDGERGQAIDDLEADPLESVGDSLEEAYNG